MKREKLESFLDKKVEIKLFDNEVINGILKKGNRYFETKKNYHLQGDIKYMVFKCSHVKTIKEINNE